MNHSIIHLFLLVGTIVPLAAQGPLTPPGAPAPTMKTLDQIEPRIDVLTLGSEPPYVINQPGSYYLSANITVPSGLTGIQILVANVTLNLNGFTIFATSGSSTGSAIYAFEPAVVRNGFIKSWGIATNGNYSVNGFRNGIIMFGGGSVTDLIVEGCELGIYADATITRCQVKNAETGITAQTAIQCVAKDCSINGISFTKRCSESRGAGFRHGIWSFSGEIDQCEGIPVKRFGISGNNISRSKGIGGEAGIIAGGNVSDSSGICAQYDPYISYIYGIQAAGNVSNSKAECTGVAGTSTNWFGIQCDNAMNCSATSNGIAIRAFGNVTNCYGKGGFDGIGIWAEGTATSCRGDHYAVGGTALRAAIAVSCTRAQGIIDSPSKHLGTP